MLNQTKAPEDDAAAHATQAAALAAALGLPAPHLAAAANTNGCWQSVFQAQISARLQIIIVVPRVRFRALVRGYPANCPVQPGLQRTYLDRYGAKLPEWRLSKNVSARIECLLANPAAKEGFEALAAAAVATLGPAGDLLDLVLAGEFPPSLVDDVAADPAMGPDPAARIEPLVAAARLIPPAARNLAEVCEFDPARSALGAGCHPAAAAALRDLLLREDPANLERLWADIQALPADSIDRTTAVAAAVDACAVENDAGDLILL